MPHEGRGGGFHGGGHHGGGRYRRTIFWGPPIVWWGYGWRSPYYWEARAWCRIVAAFVVAIVVIIILIITVVAARYDNNTVSLSYLSPGDTRLVSPSSTLCESTTLNNPASTVSLTVYLLQNKPALSARNNFTVTRQFSVGYREYQYWSFYLYPGSIYTLSSCLVSGAIKYYIIKGKSSFDSWVSSLNGSAYSSILYSDQCRGTNRIGGLTFNSEDEYYFVFYNDFFTTVTVKMTLNFNGAEYMPQSGGVVDSCTAPPTSTCSLTIPYNSDYWVLVETSPPSDGQWDANVNAGTSCNARVWVYVVMVLAPLIGIILIVATTIRVCCCGSNDTQRGDTTYAPSTNLLCVQLIPVTTEIVTLPSAPPPPGMSSPGAFDPPPPYMYSEPPPPYSSAGSEM